MAEPVKRGDRYRHSVMVNGSRLSGTFDTKKQAREWEALMRLEARVNPTSSLIKPKHTLADACDKYLATHTKLKRNADDWETRRFNQLLAEFPGAYIEDIGSEAIAELRDRMLENVSGSTVNRYFNLWGNLFNVATREWRWLQSNPFSAVRRPSENAPRVSVWGWRQIRRVLREGQRRGGKTGEVVKAFHIALATSLRLKEALAAPSGFNGLTIKLPPTKTSRSGEIVPTDARGRRIVGRYAGQRWLVGTNEASTLFCNLLKEVLIGGVQFRDARATALTLMSRRMDILTLARISRHKDIDLLRRVYYRESAEDISRRL